MNLKEKREPKISVIITTFHRKFEQVIEAIRSVEEQTYPNIELIIVDDNGKEAAADYGIEQGVQTLNYKVPIKYILNESNMGAQISRNRGILSSVGTFIAFLDDDDFWCKEKLACQVSCMDTPDVGLVYCKGYTRRVFNDGSYLDVPYGMAENFQCIISYKDLLYRDFIGTTSQVLIRKDVFAQVGLFDVSQPARQDYEMWLRISRNYTCRGVEQYLFYHTVHFDEQISRNPEKCEIGQKNIYNKYNKEAGFTGKFSLARVTGERCKQAGHTMEALKFKGKACFWLVMAVVFDRQELIYRVKNRGTK